MIIQGNNLVVNGSSVDGTKLTNHDKITVTSDGRFGINGTPDTTEVFTLNPGRYATRHANWPSYLWQKSDGTTLGEIYAGTSAGDINIVSYGKGTLNGFGIQTGINGSVATRLRIDSSGYMTLPYQPAFWAFSQAVDGSYKFINYDGAPAAHWLKPGTLNRSSSFNTTTGVFTAPIAGVYQVTCGMHCYDNTSGRKILNFYKNGVFTGEVCETTGPYDDQSTVFFINLAVNDSIYLVQNSSFTGFNASFGAVLIG